MPVHDSSLVLRDGSTDLTASASSSTVELKGGTPFNGLAVHVICPSTPTGTSPTLDITVHRDSDSTCDTTNKIAAVHAQINASGSYIIPFVDPDARSIMVKFDTGGTSPNFGKVKAYVVLNVGKKWDRNISFA